MQEARVRSLIREDPTCTEQLSLSATPTEPVLCVQRGNDRAHMPQLLRPACPGARVPKREAAAVSSPSTATREQRPRSTQREKSWCINGDPAQPKPNK